MQGRILWIRFDMWVSDENCAEADSAVFADLADCWFEWLNNIVGVKYDMSRVGYD